MTVRGQTLSIQQTVDFHVESCYSCAVLFAFPVELYNTLRSVRREQTFYCPNGHGQVYSGMSDREKFRQAEADRQRFEAALRAEEDQRKAAERELKRHRQRVKGGVCPCCKRSFVQLARHMKSQHPDFGADQ